MKRQILGRLGLSVFLVMVVVMPALSVQPSVVREVPDDQFSPVTPLMTDFPDKREGNKLIPIIGDEIKDFSVDNLRTIPPILVPVASPRWVDKGVVVAPPGKHSLTGKASWYCKAGVSVCHYKYPPGSMVAAACGKLRRAMGGRDKDWRNKFVTVMDNKSGRSVRVRLVDYCASEDKTIDLYWEPMRQLGGTGVLNVTIRW